MHRALLVALTIAAASAVAHVQTPPAQPAAAQSAPTFHLFFLGHEIGAERDTVTTTSDGRELQAVFHFLDRSTAVDLTGTLDLTSDGSPTHLVVKGHNYRLFSSDSDVTVSGRTAHVRDFASKSDVAIGGKPFFPIDNYAPIGVQEALIDYWISHGRPAEINAPPSGPISIRSRGRETSNYDVVSPRKSFSETLERLSIDGVV